MSRTLLSKEEAMALLPDDEFIHTFRGGSSLIIGADWKRNEIETLFSQYQPELSGEVATRMGHGIAIKDDSGWLFIQTRGDNK